MQALKFRVGNSIRRDSIAADQLSYASLLSTFQDLFGRPLQNETLRYRDDEFEWVDFSSDRELREALRLNRHKTLELGTARCPSARLVPEHGHGGYRGAWRRHPEESERQMNPEDTFPPRNDQPFIGRRHRRSFRHPAICDNCNLQIVGDRHKCNDCLDFDLCEACISKSNSVHPGHTFTLLPRSFPRWHHRHPERTHDIQRKMTEQPEGGELPKDETVIAPEKENIAKETEEREERQEDDQTVVEVSAPDNAERVDGAGAAAQHPLDGSALLKALQTLTSMGFEDRRKNVQLLLAFGGDLEQVMDKLLEE